MIEEQDLREVSNKRVEPFTIIVQQSKCKVKTLMVKKFKGTYRKESKEKKVKKKDLFHRGSKYV